MRQFRNLAHSEVRALADHLAEELAAWLHDARVHGSEDAVDWLLARRIRKDLEVAHELAQHHAEPVRPIGSRPD